eukprot:1160995-Pelagomonas_calceolata.AAC.7
MALQISRMDVNLSKTISLQEFTRFATFLPVHMGEACPVHAGAACNASPPGHQRTLHALLKPLFEACSLLFSVSTAPLVHTCLYPSQFASLTLAISSFALHAAGSNC